MPEVPPSSHRSLQTRWREERAVLAADPGAAFDLAKKCNGAGEGLLALEIAEVALAQTLPAETRRRLLHQKALALARLGSTLAAEETLREIFAGDAAGSEDYGLLGRVFKDLAEAASTAEEKRRLRTESLRHYRTGFERTGSAFNGINAAALAALLGDTELSATLARATLAAPSQGDPFYDTATQAEAELILGHADEAGALYRRAAELVEGRWADMASTRRQCRLLAAQIYGQRDRFEDCFPRATVAVFAGHLLDAPDRPQPRFPASAAAAVRARLVDWLRREHIRFAFSSAASGADLLFLSAAEECGVETHLVLPFAAAEFCATSVRPAGEEWVARFDRALERAKSVTIVNEEVADEKASAYDFANRVVAAHAALRAAQLEVPRRGLAVWDGEPRAEHEPCGGTADAVAIWSRAKIPCHVLHPTDPARDGTPAAEIAERPTPFPQTRAAVPEGARTETLALLHFYFAGWFGLRESGHLHFQQSVLGPLARVLAQTVNRPLARYGLGPDYIFVCPTIRGAGLLAHELLAALTTAPDPALSLEPPRIALHAGPVQLMVNPVLNQYAHEGATLTRAGRLTRRLPPGVCYATEVFAALAALESIREFRFESHGTIEHEEGGRDRLFRVVLR